MPLPSLVQFAEKEMELRKAYETANLTENAYRMAKAKKFLELSCPKDGSKKPSETLILSMIDADEGISALRLENMKAQADLDVKKMVFRYLTKVWSAEDQ